MHLWFSLFRSKCTQVLLLLMIIISRIYRSGHWLQNLFERIRVAHLSPRFIRKHLALYQEMNSKVFQFRHDMGACWIGMLLTLKESTLQWMVGYLRSIPNMLSMPFTGYQFQPLRLYLSLRICPFAHYCHNITFC